MKEAIELSPESMEGYSHFADINGKIYDVYKLIELTDWVEVAFFACPGGSAGFTARSVKIVCCK